MFDELSKKTEAALRRKTQRQRNGIVRKYAPRGSGFSDGRKRIYEPQAESNIILYLASQIISLFALPLFNAWYSGI
jgi:hypothetical protein